MIGRIVATGLLVAASSGFVPPKFLSGDVPQNQILAVGGGEVLLELLVDDRGVVSGSKTLRETSPFTAPVQAAASSWRFSPAEEEFDAPTPGMARVRKPVASKALMAAVFRPPTINTPTFGDMPKDIALPSDEVPFPTSIIQPLYPPRAMFDGVVLVEVRVGADGRVMESKILKSAAAFDQSALDATRQWTFRPGRLHGIPVETFAYLVFGFRQPVTIAP